jgi:hypothetical protein
MAVVKKSVLWLVLAFLVYTVIAAPTTAADAVRQAFGGLHAAAGSLGDFFDALLR